MIEAIETLISKRRSALNSKLYSLAEKIEADLKRFNVTLTDTDQGTFYKID